jgi:hypothetical protein
MVRRLAGLKTVIGYDEDIDTLPVTDRLAIRDLEDQINRQDYAAVDKSFNAFENDKEFLALISSRVRLLLRQLLDQRTMLRHARRSEDEFLLHAVIDSEYRRLQEILGERETGSDETQDGTGIAPSDGVQRPPSQSQQEAKRLIYNGIIKRIRTLSKQVGKATNLMDDFLARPEDRELRAALYRIRAGGFDKVDEIHDHFHPEPLPIPPGGPGSSSEGPLAAGNRQSTEMHWRTRLGKRIKNWSKWFPHPEAVNGRGPRISALFRYARPIAGIASVVVVSLVGMKLQYLDNQTFSGGLTSWLGLTLWAATVELSGVSVLEVLGRLGSGGAPATTGMR